MCLVINKDYVVEEGFRYKFLELDPLGNLLSPYEGTPWRLNHANHEEWDGAIIEAQGFHVFPSIEDAQQALKSNRRYRGTLDRLHGFNCLVLVKCEVNRFVAGGEGDTSMVGAKCEIWRDCKPIEIVPKEQWEV